MPKSDKDCSSDFHRVKRNKGINSKDGTCGQKKDPEKAVITPVRKKIKEDGKNLKGRENWFKKRTGGAKP